MAKAGGTRGMHVPPNQPEVGTVPPRTLPETLHEAMQMYDMNTMYYDRNCCLILSKSGKTLVTLYYPNK